MNRFSVVMLIVFVALLWLSAVFYTFQKCGWKTFLLGNGAGAAAVMDMCDE